MLTCFFFSWVTLFFPSLDKRRSASSRKIQHKQVRLHTTHFWRSFSFYWQRLNQMLRVGGEPQLGKSKNTNWEKPTMQHNTNRDGKRIHHFKLHSFLIHTMLLRSVQSVIKGAEFVWKSYLTSRRADIPQRKMLNSPTVLQWLLFHRKKGDLYSSQGEERHFDFPGIPFSMSSSMARKCSACH